MEEVAQLGGVPYVANTPFQYQLRDAQWLSVHMLGRLNAQSKHIPFQKNVKLP
jgi:hypothetical protein